MKMIALSKTTSGMDASLKTLSYTCGFIQALHKEIHPIKTSSLSTGLGQISSALSLARYPLRFFGTFDAYSAMTQDTWACEEDTYEIRRLIQWQAYSMILYHPLEHASWLGWT